MSTEENAENMQAVEVLEYTQVKIIQTNYTWIIKNFMRDFTEKREIKSPIFTAGCNGKLKWYLKIHKSCSNVDVSLCLLPCNVSKITVSYTASLLNGNGQKVLKTKKKSTCKAVCPEKITLYTADETFENANVCKGSNGLLPGGNLTIFCEIDLVVSTLIVPVNDAAIKFPECQLSENMGYLFENEKFSDVIINVCEMKEFPAHKAILSVRSRVFSAMFDHEMAEKLRNRVEVSDVEPEVFREMLRYIYTGEVPLIGTMADKLLMAAEKYELERLKLMCEETLRTNLTPENATDMLILADLQNADQLKASTVEFIALNAAEVMETPRFKALLIEHPYVRLMADVIRVSAIRNSAEAEESLLNLLG